MPCWVLKAAIQGALSWSTEPQRFNRILQTHVTGSSRVTSEMLADKWEHCVRHLSVMSATPSAPPPNDIEGKRILEIGIGWNPIVPISLALMGFRKVFTFDVQPLVHREAVEDIVEVLATSKRPLLSGERVDRALTLCRSNDKTAAELLSAIGVEPLVGSPQRVLPRLGHVDLITSNNTLEHLPERELRTLLGLLRQIGTPETSMSHHIDLADHYALFDPSISRQNFLRFEDRTWRLFNNRLHYQNRLRLSDYLRLTRETGWRPVVHEVARDARESLGGLRLARRFQEYDLEDLLVHEAWIGSTPAEGVPACS